MSTVAPPADDLERVLALKSLRDATARGHFLAAMRELGRDGADFTRERLGGLLRLEEHFQALLNYDQIDFLRQPASITEADREFALTIQRTWLEAANGLQRFLRNRAAWAGREDIELVARVTGLALNAIHGFIKWGYFLAEAGRTPPWKQVHALYVLADAEGYAQQPFVLHASRPSFKPSVQSLYLRTLFLGLLNSGNLSKLQVEIADGWFSSWCSDYSIDVTHSSRHHLFCVDIASDAGLSLMAGEMRGDSVRYVRADALKAQIDEVQAGLRRGQLFAGYGAGAVFPVEAHVALLEIVERLYRSIHAAAENRIEERTHFEDREVDVTLGFECVVRHVRAAISGEAPAAPAAPPAAPTAPALPPLTLSDTFEISDAGLSQVEPAAPAAAAPAEALDPEVERWRVHDLSTKGFGLIVDRAAAEGVLLNGLVGLRNHETGGWIVGSVVRKLPNRVVGEVLVGVEVLGFRPIAIALEHVKRKESAIALYLPGTDANGKLDSIVVRTVDFTSDNVFDLAAGGARYRINLNRILRKGADWVRARFEIQAKI